MEKYCFAIMIILGLVAALLFFYCLVLRHSLKCLEKQAERLEAWLAEEQAVLDNCMTETVRKISKNDRKKLSEVYKHEFEDLVNKKVETHAYSRRCEVVKKLYFYMKTVP